jgi:hypothetical protein
MAFCVAVVVLEVLFTWYSWFSPSAPFALHELHGFAAAEKAREAGIHYFRTGGLFAVLFAWFLSLPIVRLIHQKRTTLRV